MLDRLPADVRRPGFAPAEHGVGIVHLGIGAFHRAHQAVMTDDCLALHGGDWRIMGVSLRSAGVRDQLAPQGGLYTLCERDGEAERLRIIAAVAGVLVAAEDVRAVIDLIAAPTTHVISLTITEKGYCHDPATGQLLADHPDILHDRATPEAPRSAIGVIVAGLARRMRQGSGPITIISCDNLPDNGRVLAGVVRALAARTEPELLPWLDRHVRFPATMVDRIVPATTGDDLDRVAARLGCTDAGMVKAEPFSQWVIEDDFAGPRPRWEDAGAQLVADVRPFELAKLRMLNGSHSTLAYLGLLAGHETVDQAMADPAIAAVIDQLMLEAAATLPVVPGLDPTGYATALRRRFSNAALAHRLAQIAMDGSQKLPQRLLGTIVDRHRAGARAQAATMGIAAWMRHFAGPHVNDPLGDRLRAAVADDPATLVENGLAIDAVFGEHGRAPWLRDLLVEAMEAVDQLMRAPA